MAGFKPKPTGPTGIFPNGGDTLRWSYVRDGRVVFSGPLAECELRWAIAGRYVVDAPGALERAIRRNT